MQDWTPDELKSKLDAGEKVFLKLWKKGCGACKMSKPAIERIENAYQTDDPKLLFAQINVDDHPEMLEIAETEVLPTFFAFKEGKLAGKVIGFKGKAKLDDFFAEHF